MLSRIARMKKDREDPEYQPDMPPVPNATYLLGYLFEIGPVMSAGAGPAPLSNQEIAAWQQLTSIRLRPWESRFLRRLSREYISETHAAEKANRPAPWTPTGEQVDLTAAAMDLRASMRALAEL